MLSSAVLRGRHIVANCEIARTQAGPLPLHRRLLLFKYDGLEFVEQREVSLPDAATCMQLAGGTLYVGLAKRCGWVA